MKVSKAVLLVLVLAFATTVVWATESGITIRANSVVYGLTEICWATRGNDNEGFVIVRDKKGGVIASLVQWGQPVEMAPFNAVIGERDPDTRYADLPISVELNYSPKNWMPIFCEDARRGIIGEPSAMQTVIFNCNEPDEYETPAKWREDQTIS